MKTKLVSALFAILLGMSLIGCSAGTESGHSTDTVSSPVEQSAHLEALDSSVTVRTVEEPSPEGIFRIHFLDVGQGDSTFLELPTGETMLIDAGEAEYASHVSTYIHNLGYAKIDYLVATHPHSDHIGGMSSIIATFDIGEIWAPNVTHTTNTYENFLDAVASKKMSIRTAETGKDIILMNGFSISIVSPRADSSYTDLNDWSAILSIDYDNNSFLFPGDASAGVITASFREHVDVLKVSHHGSNTGTTASLISMLSPSYAVISCGQGNPYGHPTDSVLSFLANTNTYRTDLQGTIIIESDGTTISCNTEPWRAPQTAPEAVSTTSEVAEVAEVAPVDPTPTANDNGYIEVYITNTGAKYHSNGCRYLSNSKIPISLEDAIAQGYGPCSVCNPPR